MNQQQLLLKNTDFFISKIPVQAQFDKDRFLFTKDLFELVIQVRGYGIFDQIPLLNRFQQLTAVYLRHFNQIRYLTLEIVGFSEAQIYDQKYTLISKIYESLVCCNQLTKLTLNFTNFKPGQYQDFKKSIEIISNTQLELEEVSLNFCNWNLGLSAVQIQKDLMPIFELWKFKKSFECFGLELSGWYYTEYMPLLDLKQKETETKIMQKQIDQNVKKLHELIKRMVEAAFQCANNEVVIDFRNWHNTLKMKQLKKKVDNIIKFGSYQKSIIQSTRLPEEGKQFKFVFLV